MWFGSTINKFSLTITITKGCQNGIKKLLTDIRKLGGSLNYVYRERLAPSLNQEQR